MNILVIPTTDWIKHPVPNRLNFIFDILAEDHQIYVLHFRLKRFRNMKSRETKCKLIDTGWKDVQDPSLYYIMNFPSHFQSIKKVIEEEEIDVILSANILPSLLANFFRKPIVFDYLDHLEESASIYYPGTAFGGLVRNWVKLITRYNLRKAQSVITVTDELAKFLQGLSIRDVAVIPNGVDTTLLRPIPIETAKKNLGLTGNIIGYVGSLEHWVDLETVIEALPNLDVTLLVVGPGLFTDYSNKIKKLAKSLGVEKKIKFTGAVPYSEISKYISSMDIGLNPLKKMRKNEFAAGGKVFNYLACDRPVLSSRMISLERLLKDDIYYYEDVQSFISQARQILFADREKKNYRIVAEKYDWRKLAIRYEKVLQDSIGC
jgi:glycosyltransferase involved in cell wall biosynthesis